MYRWIRTDRARYYQAILVKDLFGDWSVITAWGSLGSKRGGMRSTSVVSFDAGLERIRDIEKRRKQHGYRSV